MEGRRKLRTLNTITELQRSVGLAHSVDCLVRIFSHSCFSHSFFLPQLLKVVSAHGFCFIVGIVLINNHFIFHPFLSVEKARNFYVIARIMFVKLVFCIISTILCITSLFWIKYSRMDQIKVFKGCLPHILLGPFLNTFSYLLII